jgi:hypothetical protein
MAYLMGSLKARAWNVVLAVERRASVKKRICFNFHTNGMRKLPFLLVLVLLVPRLAVRDEK